MTPFVSARLPKPARARLVDSNTGELIKDPKIGGRLFLREWKRITVQEGFSEEQLREDSAEEEESTRKSDEGGEKTFVDSK